MNIRPEDRSKMIGIAAAIIGLNIYVFASIVPRLSGAQTVTVAQNTEPPASTSVAPPGPVAAPASPAGNGGTADPTQSPADDKGKEKSPKDVVPDPFTPPAGTVPSGEPASLATAQPPANPQQAGAPTKPGAQDTAPQSVAPPQAIAAAPAPAPMPNVELKGLIDGTPAVAVFQIGSEIYHKEVGDKLPGGLVVARITEADVILHKGNQRYVLDVGHSLAPTNDSAQPQPAVVASTTASDTK